MVAQLVDGVLGAALVYATYADTATGATTFGADVGYVRAMVAEAMGAFILVTAVFALAVAPPAHGRRPGRHYPSGMT